MRWLISLMLLSAVACRGGNDELSKPKLETDDRWTAQTIALVDVSPFINRYVNDLMNQARREANPSSAPWTEDLKIKLLTTLSHNLTSSVRNTGVGLMVGPLDLEVSSNTVIEDYLQKHLDPKKNEIHFTTFQDSRYGDNKIGIFHAVAPSTLTQSAADKSIAPVVRLHDTLVGLDKFSHFFEQGFWNFTAMQGGLLHSTEDQLRFGLYMEGDSGLTPEELTRFYSLFRHYEPLCVMVGCHGFFGLKVTGVISYADINANLQGYLFFDQLWHAPQNLTFDILTYDYHKWNEETVKSKFVKGLLVRPQVPPE